MSGGSSSSKSRLVGGALLIASLATARIARADDPPSGDPPSTAPATTPSTTTQSAAPTAAPPPAPTPSQPPTTNEVPVAPVQSEDRATSLEPKAVQPAPKKITFAADPIADGGIIIGAASFAALLDLINGTGELRPQQIAPNFDRSQLLGIDRIAVTQKLDSNASTYSNIGFFGAVGFAAIDPILSGVRERHLQTGLVDFIIYAQSIAITWGVTNLAKIAVRRPRPVAYIDADLHKDDPNYSNSSTDSALSFFSGHASMTAAVTTTATYLAFTRSPGSWRPWVTLGVGTAVTAFTAYERVRAGAHFPTDVIAGAVAGAGIGIIVPHIHRSEDVKQRRIWVGFAPDPSGGGVMQGGGLF